MNHQDIGIKNINIPVCSQYCLNAMGTFCNYQTNGQTDRRYQVSDSNPYSGIELNSWTFQRRQKAKKRPEVCWTLWTQIGPIGGWVCPNFYCSLLFTGMCTLILWIIQTYYFTGTTCHPNMLRNCNKSLEILNFYLLTPGCQTINTIAPYMEMLQINESLHHWSALSHSLPGW